MRNDILIRTRSAQPQAEIKNRFERIKNAEGIFSVKKSPTQKIIILIDDVSTTGATLDNAARVLKKAGAKEVVGIVFARG